MDEDQARITVIEIALTGVIAALGDNADPVIDRIRFISKLKGKGATPEIAKAATDLLELLKEEDD